MQVVSESTSRSVASCANLSVADLGRMQDWYCDTLGFRLRVRRHYPAMQLEIAFLEWNGFELELIAFSGSQPADLYPDPPGHAKVRGITHFGLGVADIDAEHARVQGLGIPVLFGPKTFDDVGIRVFFIRDPEGNLLKFVERLPA